MQLKALLLMMSVSSLALAAGAPLSESDFVYRVINFTIFAAILYYFLADVVRNFFKNRREEISARLDEVSKRLQASKQAKKDAQIALEESRERAAEIIETAKKECQLIAAKFEEQAENDIKNLEKAFEGKLKLEQGKVTKEVVSEVLDELLKDDAASIDEEKFIKLVSKKVA